MKRKMTGIILTIALCAALIAGGTMAWFTHSPEAMETVFTAGTVRIEADRVIDINDSDSYEEYGEFFPARVIEANQGLNAVGGIIGPPRNNPDVVLNDNDQFFSLGFGGHIIVEFEHQIYAPELVIVAEVTNGNYPLEEADVYVSATGPEEGYNWKYAGEAKNNNRIGNTTETRISLRNLDIPYVKYVKVVDKTNKENFSKDTDDGFDVRYIKVGGYYIDEYNWNPGDKNTRIFRVTNVGTKSIHLRGKFTGAWYEYDEETGKWVKNENLGSEVVTVKLHENEDGWVAEDGWFYYKYTIPGTFPDKQPTSVDLKLRVILDGECTGNEYQGKKFILEGSFEAIQASNGASEAKGWDYIPVNKPE